LPTPANQPLLNAQPNTPETQSLASIPTLGRLLKSTPAKQGRRRDATFAVLLAAHYSKPRTWLHTTMSAAQFLRDVASVGRKDLLNDDVVMLSEADLEERVRVMLTKEGEFEYLPNPNYIAEVQRDGMRPLWRRRVTEWLLEFQEEFGISQDTVAVAVNYMDRYLSKKSTEKEIVQLLAMGAIFVAAKLHETYSIGMKELQALADEVYLASDIKLMELELLGVLQWNLNPITPQLVMNHLVYYIPDAQQRQTLREHAEAFLDVTLCGKRGFWLVLFMFVVMMMMMVPLVVVAHLFHLVAVFHPSGAIAWALGRMLAPP
jgi:hypothetical protein